MTHNPAECVKCGRGRHVRAASLSGKLTIWVCCKEGLDDHETPTENPDEELQAAREDKRQMGLPL